MEDINPFVLLIMLLLLPTLLVFLNESLNKGK